MLRKKIIYQIAVAALFLHSGVLQGQNSNSLGTFTPYSMFGMGEVVRQGTPFNAAMGGIGLSLRDHRYINYINPASITARDTLSFMLDFGVESYNLYLKDNHTKSAYNAFNMSHLVLSFPLFRKTAAVVGFTPYSHVGYKFAEVERRPEVVSEIGNVVYQHFGEGSMNQLFLGVAREISKNFFVGAQGIYYFGTLYRNGTVEVGNSSYNALISNESTALTSFSGKFGMQYKGVVDGRSVVSVGVTFLLPSTLKGDAIKLASSIQGSVVDTISYLPVDAQMKIPAEFAAGVSVGRKNFAGADLNRWMVGFDYSYQDWRHCSFSATPGIDFSPAVKSSYKLGFELTPDYYNFRYAYKRWTYRGGLYYEQSYMRLDGRQIETMGLTFGVSFPVFRSNHMLNFGVDIGQRGSMRHELVRERFTLFKASISLYDTWFRKREYQ